MFKHSPLLQQPPLPPPSLSQNLTSSLSSNSSPSTLLFDQKHLPPPAAPPVSLTHPNPLKAVSPPLNPLLGLSADNARPLSSSAQLHAPIPTRPPQTFPPVANSSLASLVAPPISLPPPVSLSAPPPPSSLTASASSGAANPYSAKGALNKKVYDTGIPVVAMPQPSILPTSANRLPDISETPMTMNGNSNGMTMFAPTQPPSSTYLPLAPPPVLQTMEQFNSTMAPQLQPIGVSNPTTNFQMQNPG